MKHTPGPWEVHEHQHIDGEFWCSIGRLGWGPIIDIVGEEGNKAKYYQPVAAMNHLVTPVEEQKANARLIAAAPELLEVLEELRRVLGMIDDFPTATGEHPDIQNRALDRAMAITAKVKGE